MTQIPLRKLTLDWNCIIELEERRRQADAVDYLVRAHRAGVCDTALLATSASENTRSRVFPENAFAFKSRISSLDLDDLPIISSPCIIGLSYFDWSFCVDEGEYNELQPALWDAMFPNYERSAHLHLTEGQKFDDAAIQSEQLADWRNRWCDVMSAYSHIHHKRDIFVTLNTRDFQRNAKPLHDLGMRQIMTPEEVQAQLLTKAI